MVNAGGANGLFYGNAKPLAIQALAVAAVLTYSFVMSTGCSRLSTSSWGFASRGKTR